MPLEFSNAAFAATADGLFIGVADLPGTLSAELAAGQPAKAKEARAVFSFLKKVFAVLSPSAFNKLGVTVSNTESRPGSLLTNRSYSYSSTYSASLNNDQITPIPIPASGVNAGLGKFAITDIFPTATKVAAAGNTAGAGILIPTDSLISYGGPIHANLNVAAGQDNRAYLAAFFNWVTDGGITIRAIGVTSAIVTASRGAPQTGTLPANAIAATDPTTGLTVSDIPKTLLSQVTYTLTVQTIDDLTSETFDVNVI